MLQKSKENPNSAIERNTWLAEEKYFARSWTHVFYRWKRHRIMMGKITRQTLAGIALPEPRIVELGCAAGESLFETFDVCTDINGVLWYGMDLNVQAICAGVQRSRFRESERNSSPVFFVAGNAYSLPFGDEMFDMVHCAEVLEHMSTPQDVISEIARILKPGGYALITTPNPNNIVERLGYTIDRLSRGGLKRNFWSGNDEISAPPLKAEAGLGHVSVYPYKLWRNWLESAGLPAVRKIRGSMLFGGPFFDRHPFFAGCAIALDPLLDLLPGRYLLSNNMGILCRKPIN
jgi:SAM-dependent methyltransferase